MSTSVARWLPGAIAVILTVAAIAAPRLHARDEVRALWVVGTSLTSPQAIEQMAAAAQQSGFNTLLVQARGRGDAYFLRGIEPRPVSLSAQPAFDPLAEAISRGHAHGLSVHAWINVNLVAGTDVPTPRGHIVYRHPEWLMVPGPIADDLATLDPTGPEYLGRLVRYARSRPDEVEGLYLSPATQEAVEYTTSVVRDVVQRYAVDGVHFDHVRYPAGDFDYGRETLRAFGQSVTAFPGRFRQFRADRLTALLAELHKTVKSARPEAVVSVAVSPDPVEASAQRLQNWSAWLNQGLMDIVCPTAYTTDLAAFASQIASAQSAAGRHPLWAGIGAYRLSSEQTIDDIRAARRIGVGGLILFSYDSLIAPPRGSGYLSQLGKAAFSAPF